MIIRRIKGYNVCNVTKKIIEKENSINEFEKTLIEELKEKVKY